MKHEESRSTRLKIIERLGMSKPCGTIAYLAECRGHGQKAGPPSKPSGIISRIVRRSPSDR